MKCFHKFGSSRKQKQKPLRAEALNFRVLMDCSNEENLKTVKGSNIIKCVLKKYFSYATDKIVSFTINFSKALIILSWVLLLFLLLFLLIVYISLTFHLIVFQEELFCISIVQLYENLVFPWSI